MVRRPLTLSVAALLASLGCTPAGREEVHRRLDEPVTVHGGLRIPEPDREVRGVWVTRWSFRSPGDVDAILDDIARAGLTHVFLQVRGRFDAFYRSDLEPWAAELSGVLGRDPGWDPLAHAVTAAHARGLELHAWVNVYALWQGRGPGPSEGVPHALGENPDWRVLDRAGRPTDASLFAYVFASPGNPEVADRVVSVVHDIATRYEVDGIHLDYVRYPGRDFGFDTPPGDPGADFDEWRRRQIRDTVARMKAGTDKPLSAAVWGVYRDRWGWHVGGGYDAYFQDAYGMIDDGSLAAVAPMIYWPVSTPRGGRLDFATLAADHVREASTGKVWTGIEADKQSWPEVEECIAAAREAGAQGFVLFEYRALRDKGWLDDLRHVLEGG